MKNLFVDMDGTLAEFKPVDAIEQLYQENYFLDLKPHRNVVDAIRGLAEKDNNIEVFVLSSVLTDSQYALREKQAWLDKYLPEIDALHRMFVPCGESKANHILLRPSQNDFLLDDYSKNLFDWERKGKAIKLLNGINGTKGTWKGSSISHLVPPDIFRVLLEEEMGLDHDLHNLPSDIQVVSEREMVRIIGNCFKPQNFGMYLCKNTSAVSQYTICDNRDGEAWTEETSSLGQAMLWFRDEIDTEDLYQASRATDRDPFVKTAEGRKNIAAAPAKEAAGKEREE